MEMCISCHLVPVPSWCRWNLKKNTQHSGVHLEIKLQSNLWSGRVNVKNMGKCWWNLNKSSSIRLASIQRDDRYWSRQCWRTLMCSLAMTTCSRLHAEQCYLFYLNSMQLSHCVQQHQMSVTLTWSLRSAVPLIRRSEIWNRSQQISFIKSLHKTWAHTRLLSLRACKLLLLTVITY